MTDPIDLARPDPGSSTSAQLRDSRAEVVELTALLLEAREDMTAELAARLAAEGQAKQWRALAELYLTQRDDALHNLAHAKFKLAMAETQRDHWKQQANLEEGS